MVENGQKIKHFTFEERKIIEKLLREGKNQREISKIIKRTESSLSYEIIRNGGRENYTAEKAEERAKLRKTSHVNSIQKLIPRIENLEMQVEILTDFIKELRKQHAKD